MTRRVGVAIGLGAVLVAIAISGFLLREYQRSPHYNRHTLPIDTYALLDDVTQLEISVHTGSWDIVDEPTVREDRERITITAWVSEYIPGTGGFKNASRYDYHLTISLRSQVGDRIVIDGTTGKPIRKS